MSANETGTRREAAGRSIGHHHEPHHGAVERPIPKAQTRPIGRDRAPCVGEVLFAHMQRPARGVDVERERPTTTAVPRATSTVVSS